MESPSLDRSLSALSQERQSSPPSSILSWKEEFVFAVQHELSPTERPLDISPRLGAHYPPFVFLYGMRMFAVLAALLIGGGTLIAM